MTSTQYDRNFISKNIFQPSTFRKSARKSSYLNSEEDIDSGREPLENSLSQQSIHGDGQISSKTKRISWNKELTRQIEKTMKKGRL